MFRPLVLIAGALALNGCALMLPLVPQAASKIASPIVKSLNPLAPPAWIRGTWEDAAKTTTFTFKEGDFGIRTPALETPSFKAVADTGAKVEEFQSSSEYIVTVTSMTGPLATTYRFTKASDTTLDFVSKSDGVSIAGGTTTTSAVRFTRK